jgi:hypothetical protein
MKSKAIYLIFDMTLAPVWHDNIIPTTCFNGMYVMAWLKKWSGHPNPAKIPQILEKLSKNLAAQNTCGKNFRGMFLDVFCLPESESEISFLSNFHVHKISKLLCLFVHDCSIGTIKVSESLCCRLKEWSLMKPYKLHLGSMLKYINGISAYYRRHTVNIRWYVWAETPY